MYAPPLFRERRPEVLHEAIRQAPFATLVTTSAGILRATHLPLVVDVSEGPLGTLIGHVARPNPQWQGFDGEVDALATFLVAHAYVSPSHYPSKRDTGKAVPTWNYIAVHASGPLEVIDDAGELHAIVERITEHQESGRPEPWHVEDAPADFVAGMLRGIVGLRMPIRHLEGSWKLSQNRTPADREGVMEGLSGGDPGEQAIAAAMRRLYGERG